MLVYWVLMSQPSKLIDQTTILPRNFSGLGANLATLSMKATLSIIHQQMH